ncbi:stalk domain-containing protein [Cohnella fermenti]|uniref:Copper amine oxidase-like N-terminal domain-containing protein n=1 Tax=Cohnella fermenti TaxID=2565925 RepID=A0A4S4C796_9BACL|nr:stalk domain-containing protein [Cohnella fermenti]THF83816.1 hypothetical protein E6C55_03810 [Cohnella fermenti]
MKMKCVKSVLVGMTAVFTLVSTMNAASAVAASSDIQVILDGKRIAFVDAKPYADSGRVLVPLRVVSENLGAKVDYSNNVVTISQGSSVVKLTIGSKTASVNGKAVSLDSVPTVKSSRVFVPLRFVSEQLGQAVDWDSVDQYVWIGEKTLPNIENTIPVESTDAYKVLYRQTPDLINYDASGRTTIQVLDEASFPIYIPYGFSTDTLDLSRWDKQLYSFSLVQIDKENFFRVHYSGYSLAICLLGNDGYPRGRAAEKHTINDDGSFTDYYPIVSSGDKTFYNDAKWASYKPIDVKYVQLSIDSKNIVLIKSFWY